MDVCFDYASRKRHVVERKLALIACGHDTPISMPRGGEGACTNSMSPHYSNHFTFVDNQKVNVSIYDIN